jgi:glutamate racemase
MGIATHGDPRPIGVFDSGVGGLTVARALMDLLPDERLIYVGDTARGPYGPRDLAEVRGFASEIIAWLADQGAKLVVAACNTATAALLETDPPDFPVPVVGVIQPAVTAAVRATATGRVGVIGTAGTVRSGAYERAMDAAAPQVDLYAQACPRFVELAERGRTTDPEVRSVAASYLAPLRAAGVDTLILGCTHYPLLTGVLAHYMGPEAILVSSAEETARTVFRRLVDEGLDAGETAEHRVHRFAVSGDGDEFNRLAARFLGPRIVTVGETAAVVQPGTDFAVHPGVSGVIV